MALGIRRSRFGIDATRLFSVRAVTPVLDPAPAWTQERGRVLLETQADVTGGFPGFADLGAVIPSAKIRVTDGYVTVDEGEPRGFGLPLAWIDGFVPLHGDGEEAPVLLRYHDGVVLRTLQLRFRSGRVGTRNLRRSARLQEAFVAAGIPEIAASPSPVAPFTLPWHEAGAFESEQVVWSGAASAPVALGGALVASEIWLTTKSLIWGSGAGDGINRIPLEYLIELVSTRLRDRIGTPAIYLAVACEPLGRIDSPFVFNRLNLHDLNFRERAGMQEGLQSLGIPDGEAVPYWQPWRDTRGDGGREEIAPDAVMEAESAVASEGGEGEDWDKVLPEAESCSLKAVETDWQDAEPVALPARAVPIAEPEADLVATAFEADSLWPVAPAAVDFALADVEKPDDSTDRLPSPTSVVPDVASSPEAGEDVLLAVWTAAAATASPAMDTAISQRWAEPATVSVHEPDPDLYDAWPVAKADDLPTVTELRAAPEPIDPWATIRRYEAAALDALDELFHAIDRRAAGRNPIDLTQPPPSSHEQSRALAQLTELTATGGLSAIDAGRRRERILALGDSCVRLRTLIELHASGYLTDGELGLKRKKLVDGLSISLVRM